MRATVTRWFENDRSVLYQHLSRYRDLEAWLQLPEKLTLDANVEDDGRLSGFTVTMLVEGERWTMTFDNVYDVECEETRSVLRDIVDASGQHIMQRYDVPVREIATRVMYASQDGGTLVTVELHLRSNGIAFWLDTYLMTRDWRKQTEAMLARLESYLASRRLDLVR